MKNLRWGALALPVILATAACSGSGEDNGNGGGAGSTTVTVALIYGSGSWESVPVREFGEAVNDASDGTFNFEYHYAESLLPANEIADGMTDGIVDLAMVYPPYNPTKFPVSNWVARLGIVNEASYPLGNLATDASQREWVLGEQVVIDEFRNEGIHILTNAQSIGMFDLLCQNEVTSLADARGKRVRVAGEAWANEATNIGMEPVQLAGGEMYEAFQRGVIDCAMIHPSTYIDTGIWEVGNHYTAANFAGWNQHYLGVSLDFWEGLSQEEQQYFTDAANVWVEGILRGYYENNRRFVVEGSEEHDIVFHTMDDAMQDQVDTYHDSLLTGGLASEAPTQVDDPDGMIERRLALQQEWLDRLSNETDYPAHPSWVEWVDATDGQIDFTELFELQ